MSTYKGKDLLAKVKGAKGDLSKKGKIFCLTKQSK